MDATRNTSRGFGRGGGLNLEPIHHAIHAENEPRVELGHLPNAIVRHQAFERDDPVPCVSTDLGLVDEPILLHDQPHGIRDLVVVVDLVGNDLHPVHDVPGPRDPPGEHAREPLVGETGELPVQRDHPVVHGGVDERVGLPLGLPDRFTPAAALDQECDVTKRRFLQEGVSKVIADLTIRHGGGPSDTKSIDHSVHTRRPGGDLESRLLHRDVLDLSLEDYRIVLDGDSDGMTMKVDSGLVLEGRADAFRKIRLGFHAYCGCISRATVFHLYRCVRCHSPLRQKAHRLGEGDMARDASLPPRAFFPCQRSRTNWHQDCSFCLGLLFDPTWETA